MRIGTGVEWEEVIRHGPLRGRLGLSEIRNDSGLPDNDDDDEEE